MCARVYVCVCGRRFGIAVLADVRYILRISIRNIIHVCRTPIHFHSVYSPSYIYIYICGEGWGEENGGVDERKRNKGMTVEWHGENTDFELHTHTHRHIYIYKFVWICLSLSHR